jgi:hypothetical protein
VDAREVRSALARPGLSVSGLGSSRFDEALVVRSAGGH